MVSWWIMNELQLCPRQWTPKSSVWLGGACSARISSSHHQQWTTLGQSCSRSQVYSGSLSHGPWRCLMGWTSSDICCFIKEALYFLNITLAASFKMHSFSVKHREQGKLLMECLIVFLPSMEVVGVRNSRCTEAAWWCSLAILGVIDSFWNFWNGSQWSPLPVLHALV